MKVLMTSLFAASLAAGVFAECGDSCNTYDFKASLTRPTGKASTAIADCSGYRMKATGKLTGWLVSCDCGCASLVVVIDKDKTAYASPIGFLVLNRMGKTGTEVEMTLDFALLDDTTTPAWCSPAWAIAAAGFGKVKVATSDCNSSYQVQNASGMLVGTKPGAGIYDASVCADACTCAYPCSFDTATSDVLDSVDGTWSMTYDKKFSTSTLGTVGAIGTALSKKGVTAVVEGGVSYTVSDWAANTAILSPCNE